MYKTVGYFFAVLLLCAHHSIAVAGTCSASWPLWQKFVNTHLQQDGRVVDYQAGGITTSEGQSYALFFSLVAQDRKRFDRILKWTSENLAEGDLSLHLPAWKWGKGAEAGWRVLDSNSASDADLWISYTLFQAADIWNEPKYRELAHALLKNIVAQETKSLPLLGPMLIPAPQGFMLDRQRWRLNPSYTPVQLLRYFASVDDRAMWEGIAKNFFRMIIESARQGVVPDWVVYSPDTGFSPDQVRGQYSSYESIRVYLWWAMLDQHEPLFVELRPYLTGASQLNLAQRKLPEQIRVVDGKMSGKAPSGFWAALAPYHWVIEGRKITTPFSLDKTAGYYDYVLSLFGYGWMEQRFSFNQDGSLNLPQTVCAD